jgi:hypothetical protein
MMTLIAAALAATAQAPPVQAPADAHAQHQHATGEASQQHQMMAGMTEECCCKEMMEKMHSGPDMGRMHDHSEHDGK